MKYTTTLEAAMGKICQAALLLIRHSLTRIQPKIPHTQIYTHTACFSSGRFAAGVGINSALVMLEKFSNQSSAGKTHFFEINMKRPAAELYNTDIRKRLSALSSLYLWCCTFAGCAHGVW
jgi:hypothetical protein